MTKYSIFLLDKDKDTDEARLRYRVKWDDNIVSFSVGYRVNIPKWNKDTQRCVINSTHGKKKIPASEINRELSKFEQICDDLFNEYERDNIIPDAKKFKYDFELKLGRVKEKHEDFFSIYNLFTKTVGFQNQWSKAVYVKFNSLKKHLLNFDKDITFEKIDDDYLYSFINYLQTKRAGQVSNKNATVGLKNTSIENQISFLKWFLRWASTDYYKGTSHITFKPKLKSIDWRDKEIIYLEWDELMKLFYFDFKSAKKNNKYLPLKQVKALERVRDVFCFCCFTSLRYSDVYKLKKTDIRNNAIHIVTQKTSSRLTIELNDYSKEILKRYNLKEKALPVISNQKMNDALKIMGEIVGFDTPITSVYFIGNQRYEVTKPKYSLLTTHAGRRTFIVNALMLGIPAEVVMSYTGHSDFDAMKPYVKITDDLKAKSMQLFNKKSPQS